MLDTVVALIIRSKKYFVSLIFVAIEAYNNVLTTKISLIYGSAKYIVEQKTTNTHTHTHTFSRVHVYANIKMQWDCPMVLIKTEVYFAPLL